MIYYDFHIHSALSPCGDNDMTPNNIVGMAKVTGLDAVAVTDHNTVGNVRAAMKVGEEYDVTVIPGMEVETEEEVHILTLYPTIEAAEYAAAEVYKKLPDIKNKPEIFGEQRIMDEEDNIIGYEDKLLLSATSLSIESLFDLVKTAGGLFAPAHVDRHSYSILTNLGFMPDNIDIRYIEISKLVEDTGAYMESRPELKKYKILRDSDAHYLPDISPKEACLDFDDIRDLFKG
ncbi:MAG: PHP domain-containing protein [Clostridia bacterium]|nr:PHP domain-containing protein [Clostridia bacterium]